MLVKAASMDRGVSYTTKFLAIMLTSSTLMSVLYCSMFTKFGRKKGQLSPKKPHFATWTGVLARSVVNIWSKSIPGEKDTRTSMAAWLISALTHGQSVPMPQRYVASEVCHNEDCLQASRAEAGKHNMRCNSRTRQIGMF